jgi:hypothetical protein
LQLFFSGLTIEKIEVIRWQKQKQSMSAKTVDLKPLGIWVNAPAAQNGTL